MMIVCGKRAEMPSRVAQIMFDCTASVIVSEQPQNKPRCADQTIGHCQVFKRAERKQDKARRTTLHNSASQRTNCAGSLRNKEAVKPS